MHVQPQGGALLDPNTPPSSSSPLIHGDSRRRLADSIVAKRPYDNMTGVNKCWRVSRSSSATPYTSGSSRPLDLNTASDEEILSIPGIGNRMLREFKEYRPYKNIDQFRVRSGSTSAKTKLRASSATFTIK
jgi:DNA uptake protein ComE-like DNA-binding protein